MTKWRAGRQSHSCTHLHWGLISLDARPRSCSLWHFSFPDTSGYLLFMDLSIMFTRRAQREAYQEHI